MKKLLALSIALVFILSGCSISSESARKAKNEEGNITIGFSMATLQEERWAQDRDMFLKYAKDGGANVIMQNADNDPDEQYKQVEYLIKQKIDVLVIIPQSATNCAKSVELAKQAGIPVLSYDRLVLNSGTDLYVAFDSHAVGVKMAEAAVKAAPKGNYLLIHGSPEDYNSEMFKSGYEDYLKPYIENGDIKILGEKSATDWRREDAYSFVQDWLQKDVTINAIICANDALASGAVEALSEWRMAGKVVVTGHDADLSACQRIVEGTQAVTIYKPIRTIAQKAVECAIKLAKNEKIETTEKIFDGKYQVPCVMLPVIAVNKDNMDDVIIKDGFHIKEDIYQNISNAKQ